MHVSPQRTGLDGTEFWRYFHPNPFTLPVCTRGGSATGSLSLEIPGESRRNDDVPTDAERRSNPVDEHLKTTHLYGIRRATNLENDECTISEKRLRTVDA